MRHKPIQFSSRVAVMLLMLLTTMTAWAWTGSGTTSDDPILIASKSDLETLRDNVNGGTNYNNVYFRQTAPFELTSNWTPYDSRGQEIGFLDPDCLKCGKCTQACPTKIITLKHTCN